ncbi:hypothetical protein [Nonomuraea sp. NPDC048916]|uniref:hypothetical protein n=1 Tax=Nonomuraea sp. NPDC048916 TaxID=3154232 RepID=UPI0033E66685
MAIPNAIIPALREHLETFTGPEPEALIFTGMRGGILRRSNFQRVAKWDEDTKKIGFPACISTISGTPETRSPRRLARASEISRAGWDTTRYGRR